MQGSKSVLIALLLVGACKKSQPAKSDPPAPSAAVAVAADATQPLDAAEVAQAVDAPAAPFDPGELKTPESVLYDSGRDMYMVSNINGAPNDADDNGYLTVVNPDGSNERSNANWKWIDGSAEDIKLDAPKGMAISGDTLYVADITVVRRFEAKAGKQKPDVVIEGAKFLNDVASDGAGGVFVSDTSLDASFKLTDAQAVYHIAADGKVTPRIKRADLGGPNGVTAGDKGAVWVVTWDGHIYEVDAKGKQGKPDKLPSGQLDGVVRIEGGEFLVSSWECKCVYRGKPGAWTVVVKDVESPADLDYDPKRKRILIPGFQTNQLHAHQL